MYTVHVNGAREGLAAMECKQGQVSNYFFPGPEPMVRPLSAT